jgi:hypothetical protein
MSWPGPYWDAAVLDVVAGAWAQRLVDVGWQINTALWRAYKEAGS